jgi:hypothetical protein
VSDLESDENKPKRWFEQRWLAVVLLLPGAIGMIGVLIYTASVEIAHNEERCPYEVVESRSVAGGGRITEERRSCQPDVSEHRWIYNAGDRPAVVLGARRLPATAFRSEDYTWSTGWSDGGIELMVENEGVDSRRFRERPEM